MTDGPIYKSQVSVILDRLPVMIDAIGEMGDIVFWNRQCEAVTGYSSDEIVGNEQAFELLYPDKEYRERKFFEVASKGGDRLVTEWRLRCKDGSEKLIQWHNLGDGTIVEGWRFIAVGFDITELEESGLSFLSLQKDLALRLGSAETPAEAASMVLDAVLEISPIDCGGFYVLDDARCNYEMVAHRGVSEKFVEDHRLLAFGSPQGLAIREGKPIYTTYCELVKDLELPKSEERIKALVGFPIVHEGLTVGCLNVGSHEYDFFSEAELASIETIASQLGAFIARIRVERVLDQFYKKMHRTEQLASVGVLSATVTHELNQPITVIKLFLNQALRAIEKESIDRERLAEIMNDCLAEVDEASNIVNRLKDFARKSSPYSMQKFDLCWSCKYIVDVLYECCRSNNLEVSYKCSPEVVYIEGNRSEFEQVFFILVQNAAQQASAAGKECKMSISISSDDDVVWVSVCDDCGGIDAEDVGRVFEPFFTTKGEGKGTGLGLCILKRIVENHGGDVEVRNRPGEGVCFVINLPKQ